MGYSVWAIHLPIKKQKCIHMKKVSNYFQESYKELVHKVTWPTWLQLQQATVIVLTATLIITAIVSVMDFGALSILKIIYSVFK